MSRRNSKPNKAGKTRRSHKEEDVRILKRYRQPGMPGSLDSAQSLCKALSPKWLAIFARALEGEESYTLHRPVRYRFPRRPPVVAGPGQQLQCDLVDCSAHKQNNKLHKVPVLLHRCLLEVCLGQASPDQARCRDSWSHGGNTG